MAALAERLAKAQHLFNSGRADAARDIISIAISSPHETPGELLKVAQTCMVLGESPLTERAFRRSADEFPNNAASHHNLGSFLALNNRYSEAEPAYRCALAIAPDDADTLRNLAHICANQGRLEEATTLFARAAKIEPGDFSARQRWADLLQKLGRFDEIPDVIGPLLAAEPRNLHARIALGGALNALGRYEEHRALADGFLDVAQPLVADNLKMVLDLFGNPLIDTAEESRLLRRIFAYLNDDIGIAPAQASPAKRGKLAVGYITKYLDKPNYMGFLSAVVRHHDTEAFEVTVYADMARPAAGNGIAHVGGLSDVELNQRIRADGIDILVDLNGFSSVDRMGFLAMKPAPVIVSWFNAFSTLGLKAVDYLLGDENVTPPEEDRHYIEKIWRLPECYLLWHPTAPHPPITAPPVSRNGYVTFGSLATNYKIGLKTVEVWASILRRVRDSRLIVRNVQIDVYMERFYRDAFAVHGIEPERIVTMSGTGHYQFLATYDEIDISLDSFPWNGGTTTFEALWQGVPVVTYAGNRWASRAGATILRAIGRPEWIGADLDDYADIAVALARDTDALAKMRLRQRRRIEASVLCDAAGFTARLEDAYREMYAGAASAGVAA